MQGTKILLALLTISLIANYGLIYRMENRTVSDVIVNNHGSAYVDSIYDLRNYSSTSYEGKTLDQRIDRLYQEYKKDKQATKESYYDDGKIDPFWQKKCLNNLRRISVIGAKIDIIEKILYLTVKDNVKAKQEIETLIEKKDYHEKLMDMSNFYAQFVSGETYDETF